MAKVDVECWSCDHEASGAGLLEAIGALIRHRQAARAQGDGHLQYPDEPSDRVKAMLIHLDEQAYRATTERPFVGWLHHAEGPQPVTEAGLAAGAALAEVMEPGDGGKGA